MAKSKATAENAVKHGIFRKHDQSGENFAFAALALEIMPRALGAELATNLVQAEGQNARCRLSVLNQARSIETLLAATPFLTDDHLATIDCGLRQLNRLLRYQNDSLNRVRKCRIEVLNAAEGFGPWRDRQGK